MHDVIDGRRQDDVSALFDLPSAAFEAATLRRAVAKSRAIDAFLRPRGATAQSLRLTMADQLPARLTRPSGAKLVAPAKLLLEYSPGV